MIKLIGEMEIVTKNGDFPVREPEIFAIFVTRTFLVLEVWARAIRMVLIYMEDCCLPILFRDNQKCHG